MLTRVEALHYRCLRYIDQSLRPFQILVGPNASGKTTFLDLILFLGDVVSDGLEEAVAKRTANFSDLVWGRQGDGFEIALEAEIPAAKRQKLVDTDFEVLRYEMAVGLNSENEVGLRSERLLFKKTEPLSPPAQPLLFPMPAAAPASIRAPRSMKGSHTIINKVPDGNDNFYDETGKGWDHAFKLGPRRSSLANLPEDESKFPVSTWWKQHLKAGVQQLVLDSAAMRIASPPGRGSAFRPNGSNLPWVVDALERTDPPRFKAWIAHLRTALPDLDNVRTVLRPDDNHRYLMLRYAGGLEVPSWAVSDGTLLLMALTVLAYLPALEGILLIEEPENGLHPKAIEPMFQSLGSIYGAQVLVASHSPVLLSLANPEQLLCFSKTAEGVVDVISGSDHPVVREWKRETSLGTLFASGILG